MARRSMRELVAISRPTLTEGTGGSASIFEQIGMKLSPPVVPQLALPVQLTSLCVCALHIMHLHDSGPS